MAGLGLDGDGAGDAVVRLVRVVEVEPELAGLPLYGVDVEVGRQVDRPPRRVAGAVLLRDVAVPLRLGVGEVEGGADSPRVRALAFHDVDLPAVRPVGRTREEPERRPHPLRRRELGPALEPPVPLPPEPPVAIDAPADPVGLLLLPSIEPPHAAIAAESALRATKYRF